MAESIASEPFDCNYDRLGVSDCPRCRRVRNASELTPEEAGERATNEAYRRWIAPVDASFAGNAGMELAAVLPAVAHFKSLANAVPDVP